MVQRELLKGAGCRFSGGWVCLCRDKEIIVSGEQRRDQRRQR